MKTNLSKSGILWNWALLAAAGLMLGVGCAGQARAVRQSGYLSRYHHLEKVDDTTSRFIDANRLGIYNKFQITSVKVLPTEYDGKPITPEVQRRVTDYLRASLTKALSDRYPIVTAPGVDVAEIRVAITDAYKTGSQLGLSVEGEILDSYSTFQAAAVMRTELGKIYVGDWWDSTSVKEIIDAWSARLRQAVDTAHSR